MNQKHRKSTLWSSLALLAAALASLPKTAFAAGSGPGCVIRGSAVMSSSTELYTQPVGGKSIARFTGGEVTIAATEFPETSGGRAKVSTAPFHIDGYITAQDIPVFSARDLPVDSGHLWIAANRRVEIVGASPGQVKVQKRLSFPISQTFQTSTSCEALTLSERVSTGWAPPGSARGYVVKSEQVAVYGSPGGTVVTNLHRAPDAMGILLWSTSTEGSWVHVEYRGDIILDAWAKAGELSALPPGETMDQIAQPAVRRGSPQLRVQGEPRVLKAVSEVPIRSAASESGAIIGKVEVGTEIYVLDTIAGWASVLPKSLSVTPTGDSQFWIRSKDLGI